LEYPSKILEEAILQLTKLPSVGRKTALRFALHLLKQNPDSVADFAKSIISLKMDIRYCKTCHNISDEEVCSICTNANRDESFLCVVEDIKDVLAIENTQQFKGRYHVLGGLISPIDGVGPNNLNIDSLIERIRENNQIKEVIFGLSANMEGDTTSFFIAKKLEEFNLAFSSLSRGISIGGELEYADEVTLGRSISQRIPYQI